MSGLAGVEKPTEGERNGVKDKKKVLDDGTYNRSNFLVAYRKL